MTQAPGGGLALRQTKANFSDRSTPLYLALQFENTCVKVVEAASEDDRLAGVGEQLTAQERVAHALASLPTGIATPAELAETLDLKEKTVRNHLAALNGRKRVNRMGDGRWQIVEPARKVDGA